MKVVVAIWLHKDGSVEITEEAAKAMAAWCLEHNKHLQFVLVDLGEPEPEK